MRLNTLHDLVQKKAASTDSDRTAVSFDTCTASGVLTLSYKELLAASNELTNLLRGFSLHNEHLIGLFCYPEVNLPVWVLGILQLPSPYLPLNPEAPSTHTVRIIHQCKLTNCVVQNELVQEFQAHVSSHFALEICSQWPAQNLTLVRIHRKPSPEPHDNRDMKSESKAAQRARSSLVKTSTSITDDPDSLAYVLCTSGTTGQPKIVRVPHCCIVPNIMHLRDLFGVTADDVVFLASPLTFDPSVVEMFLALCSGAQLLIVPPAIKRMPGRLARVLFHQHKTTILQATPTLLGRFGRRVLQQEVMSADSSLRILALGGEACPSPAVLRSWRQEGNRTCIFNLYGTTEVSCWATYHTVTEADLLQSSTDSVPLGEPLMGTRLEVRDGEGQMVSEGEGQIFIGGQDRVCLLDEEETVVPGTMRPTGDWVTVQGAQLFYLGRKDHLVKRHGQQLHLDSVQQAVENLTEVEACAVALCEGDKLVAFIVPSPVHAAPGAASSNAHSIGFDSDGGGGGDGDGRGSSSVGLKRGIQRRLSHLLPSHAIPDCLVLLPSLPLTSHGKVALGELKEVYKRYRERLGSHKDRLSADTLKERLLILWKEALGLPEDVSVEAGANFLLSGGDSLQALRFCDSISVATGTSSAGLLEVVLDGSYADILRHVTMAPFPKELELEAQVALKRRYDDDDDAAATVAARAHSPVPPKRPIEDPSMTGTSTRPVGVVAVAADSGIGGHVVRRAGEVLRIGGRSHATESKGLNGNEGGGRSPKNSQTKKSLTPKLNPQTAILNTTLKDNDNLQSSHIFRPSMKTKDLIVPTAVAETSHLATTVKDNDNPQPSHISTPFMNTAVSDSQEGTTTTSMTTVPQLSLRVRWSSDTGRCVDASPVLLVETVASGRSRATVFTGSHSHRLQALELTSGEVRWERVLGDRLESSAAVAVSACGTLVVVGCYDGLVYFLHADSGETWWTFETRDAVKSSPTVDPVSGLVIVGSHDAHAYALNPQEKSLVWKRHCGGGAVFSSPCLHPTLRLLYAATLQGHLLCLHPETGATVWTRSRGVPFFSSPRCSNGAVFIGSVDGNVCAFSHTGDMLWQCSTTGPVFSSPCLVPSSIPPTSNQTLVCGSHDGCVYSLSCADGSVRWKFQTGGKVYSSPFAFRPLHPGGHHYQTLVAVASTDGTVWVLNAEDGSVCASLSLPGELFSSPVVWGQTLVIGCRNDYVYCLELPEFGQGTVMDCSAQT